MKKIDELEKLIKKLYEDYQIANWFIEHQLENYNIAKDLRMILKLIEEIKIEKN